MIPEDPSSELAVLGPSVDRKDVSPKASPPLPMCMVCRKSPSGADIMVGSRRGARDDLCSGMTANRLKRRGEKLNSYLDVKARSEQDDEIKAPGASVQRVG